MILSNNNDASGSVETRGREEAKIHTDRDTTRHRQGDGEVVAVTETESERSKKTE